MAIPLSTFTPDTQDSPATQTLAANADGAAILIGPRRVFQIAVSGLVMMNTGTSAAVAAATETSPVVPANIVVQFDSGSLFTHIRFHASTLNGGNSLVSVTYLDRS